MKLKRVRSIFIAVILCIGCFGTTVLAVDTTTGNQVTIEVIHTGDIHGRSAHVTDQTVGFEKLATAIQQQKADLVVDVGDLFHGRHLRHWNRAAAWRSW